MGKRPKQTFFQSRQTDGQKAHEKMFNIAIRETQIKIKPRRHNHLTPVENEHHCKRSTDNKRWRGCGEKGGPTLL